MAPSLSQWAHTNAKLSFALIIPLVVALAWLGVAMGLVWGPVSEDTLLIVASLVTAGMVLVHLAHWNNRLQPGPVPTVIRHRNLRLSNLALYSLTFLMFVGLGRRLAGPDPVFEQQPGSLTEVAARSADNTGMLSFNAVRLKARSMAQPFKQWLQKGQEGDKAPVGKIILVILAATLAMGLLLFLAALSCSLACSEAGALAVLLFFGVGPLILILFGFTFINIWGLRQKPNRRKGAWLATLMMLGIVIATIMLSSATVGLTIVGALGIIGLLTGLVLLGRNLWRQEQSSGGPTEPVDS